MSNSPQTATASERALAGACLLGAEQADAVAEFVCSGDFAEKLPRQVFVAAQDLAEAGQPVNAGTVGAELVAGGQLEGSGGMQALDGLLKEAASGKSIEYHAVRVRGASKRRRLYALASEVAAAAQSHGVDTEQLVSEFEQKLFDIGRRTATEKPSVADGKTCIQGAIDRIDARQNPDLESRDVVPTGLPMLDEVLGGGLRPGSLTIIGARPSDGKSSLATGFALGAAAAGISSLFVSLEMPHEEIGERLLAMLSGVDLRRIRGFKKLFPEEAEHICQFQFGNTSAILFDDRVRQTAAQIASTARRMVTRHKIGLVIVDYLQLVLAENPKDARYMQVGTVGRRLKELARMVNVPVVACAQLSRAVEARNIRQPKLSDLRESGELEQDADNVFLLCPEAAAEGVDIRFVDLLVAKQRNGPRDRIIKLTYNRPQVRFDCREADLY